MTGKNASVNDNQQIINHQNSSLAELLRSSNENLKELIKKKDVLERRIHNFINYREKNPKNLNEQMMAAFVMKTLHESGSADLVKEKLEVENQIENVQNQIKLIESQIQANADENKNIKFKMTEKEASVYNNQEIVNHQIPSQIHKPESKSSNSLQLHQHQEQELVQPQHFAPHSFAGIGQGEGSSSVGGIHGYQNEIQGKHQLPKFVANPNKQISAINLINLNEVENFASYNNEGIKKWKII